MLGYKPTFHKEKRVNHLLKYLYLTFKMRYIWRKCNSRMASDGLEVNKSFLELKNLVAQIERDKQNAHEYLK